VKLVCVNNYENMCSKAAHILLSKVKTSQSLNLGFATGATPIGIYRQLVEDHYQNRTSFSHVTTFNLDEYIGLEPQDPNSYHYYMYHHLFAHIDLPIEQVHLPRGNTDNSKEECLRYENSIKEAGGIDIQLLGLGENGHIGFNEPGNGLNSFTHIVELTDSTRKANARFFPSVNEVPTHAITMGIQTILNCKEILLVVSGKKKATALARLLNCDSIDPSFPASVLRAHPKVTIIADQESVSSLACV
jgi:glucosamine-6-phosphate deaminase